MTDIPVRLETATPDVAAPSALSERVNLFDLDRAGMERFFVEVLGEKRFRAHQIMKWMYHLHVTDISQMTDVGKVLRAKLEQHCEIRPPNVVLDKASEDGTH